MYFKTLILEKKYHLDFCLLCFVIVPCGSAMVCDVRLCSDIHRSVKAHCWCIDEVSITVAGQQAKKDDDKEKSKEKTGVSESESQQLAPESPQPKTVSGMCVCVCAFSLQLSLSSG